MDRELYEASLTGNTTTLQKLLHEDELMLDKALAANAPETPLHIAALRGHVEFAAQILCQRPELAKELNSQGLSPLHLASANGQCAVIKELLKVAPDSISCRDREGRTPLHTAAAKGRIEVFEELTRYKPELTGDLTSRGETVLHLCVKYEHMEALKMFIARISDAELVNRKDGNGNTVLHLSTAMKHVPMIKFLIDETRVQVNTRNTSGLTALDVLAVYPSESIGDMEIEQILRRKGAKGAWELTQLTGEALEIALVDHPPQENMRDHTSQESVLLRSLDDRSRKFHEQWIEETELRRKDDMKKTMMVIAVLIVTVAFQATLTPPGGLWQEDSQVASNSNAKEIHVAGTAILDKTNPNWLAVFWFCNKVSFFSSLYLIFDNADVSTSQRRLIVTALLSMELMYIASSIPITRGGHKRVFLADAAAFIFVLLVVYVRRNKNKPSTDDNGSNTVSGAPQLP